MEISISVYHYHFPVSVVDEDAQRRFITNGSEDHSPESQARFGSPVEERRDMFPNEFNSAPSPVGTRFGIGLAIF